MNNPQPVPPSSTNVAPTLGSMVGVVAGLVATSKLGFDPVTPTGGSIAIGVTGLVTALFHWLGKATGIPGLG
jgi:hypothetical protein